MFLIFAFILLLNSPFSFVCSQNKLEILVENCSQQNNYAKLYNFELYLDSVFVKKIDLKNKTSKKIYGLKEGKYLIKYKTIFKSDETIDFEIIHKTTKKIVLCLDYLDHSIMKYYPFINRINNEENYSIEFHSQGCFHNSRDTLTISKTNDEFYIKFKDKIKKLNESEIQLMEHFEIELGYMHNGGCTTTEDYTLRYNTEAILIYDGSCKWYGFKNLLKTLNIEQNKLE